MFIQVDPPDVLSPRLISLGGLNSPCLGSKNEEWLKKYYAFQEKKAHKKEEQLTSKNEAETIRKTSLLMKAKQFIPAFLRGLKKNSKVSVELFQEPQSSKVSFIQTVTKSFNSFSKGTFAWLGSRREDSYRVTDVDDKETRMKSIHASDKSASEIGLAQPRNVNKPSRFSLARPDVARKEEESPAKTSGKVRIVLKVHASVNPPPSHLALLAFEIEQRLGDLFIDNQVSSAYHSRFEQPGNLHIVITGLRSINTGV